MIGVALSRCGWCYTQNVRERHCLNCGALRYPDIDGKPSCVWQIPKRETEYRARDLPPLEHVASLLFQTDPEVRAFVIGVADHMVNGGYDEGAWTTQVSPRFQRAMQIAYERDEHGWATRARGRAIGLRKFFESEVHLALATPLHGTEPKAGGTP